jgi:hypothetical protein
MILHGKPVKISLFLFLLVLSMVIFACPHITSITVENSVVGIGEQFRVTVTANSPHSDDWGWNENKTFQYKLKKEGTTEILRSGSLGRDDFSLFEPGIYQISASALGVKGDKNKYGEWGGSATVTVVKVDFVDSQIMLCVGEKKVEGYTVLPTSAKSKVKFKIADETIAKIVPNDSSNSTSDIITVEAVKKGNTKLRATISSGVVVGEIGINIGDGVSISTPIRGNGLPASVPLNNTREITVKYCEESAGSEVVFTIEGPGAGTANFNGQDTITKTSTAGGTDTLTIKGITQTPPNKALGLKVVAKINGKEVGKSGGFSVCAHIQDITLTGIDKDGLKVGMIVNEKAISDHGGDNSVLDKCQYIERVHYSEVSAPWVLYAVNQQALPHSGNGTSTDTHSYPITNLTLPINTTGNMIADQKHDLTCQRCGMSIDRDRVPIPAPFTIKRECKKDDKNRFFVETIKEGLGGPLTSSKEYVSPPEKPSNLQIIPVLNPLNPDVVNFVVKWDDNSDIELKYELQFIVMTDPPVGSGVQILEANLTEYSVRDRYVKKKYKWQKNYI